MALPFRVISETALDQEYFAAVARTGSVEPVDKALLLALASFVRAGSQSSDLGVDSLDIPSRTVLASCIGRSVDTVDRSTKRLEEQGLINVVRRPVSVNARQLVPSVYRLLDHPRAGSPASRSSHHGGGALNSQAPEMNQHGDSVSISRAEASRPDPLDLVVLMHWRFRQHGGQSLTLSSIWSSLTEQGVLDDDDVTPVTLASVQAAMARLSADGIITTGGAA